jgi:hypothetical protein
MENGFHRITPYAAKRLRTLFVLDVILHVSKDEPQV